VIRVFGWQTSTAAEHDFRIGLPFPLLDPTRFETAVGTPGSDIFEYDVVFAHRLAGRSDLWRHLCANYPDVLCVYDMDDDLLAVDPENTTCYRIFHPLAQETRRNVEAADIVTVSSPVLAERYEKINPNVVVLPQVIPDGMCDWPRPAEDRPLTVGWAGSMHKQQDWPGIAEALQRFARIQPDVRFRMYGGDYTRGLLAGRCEFVPFTDPLTYWRSLAFDIGIAPLVDTPFNRGKTTTKLLEYGAAGIPTVASAIGQYVEWIDEGVNGWLVRDPSEWLPYLIALTDDQHRHALGDAARDKARESEVSKHVHRWESVFEGKVS
jgi:glycosyltransferase involved in cell wall biosynthesis